MALVFAGILFINTTLTRFIVWHVRKIEKSDMSVRIGLGSHYTGVSWNIILYLSIFSKICPQKFKFHVNMASGVPRIFFGGRGFQQIQLRTVGRENGDLGVVAPSQGLRSICKRVNPVFLLGCYWCNFHGTGNSAQLCQNFGISGGWGGGGWTPKPPSVLNMTTITGTLHEFLCTFMIISRSFLKIKSVAGTYRENQNTHFVQYLFFFWNRAVYKITWKKKPKKSQIGHRRQCGAAHFTLYDQNTLRICDTYTFNPAAMVCTKATYLLHDTALHVLFFCLFYPGFKLWPALLEIQMVCPSQTP
jgi:hypothetical protein